MRISDVVPFSSILMVPMQVIRYEDLYILHIEDSNQLYIYLDKRKSRNLKIKAT